MGISARHFVFIIIIIVALLGASFGGWFWDLHALPSPKTTEASGEQAKPSESEAINAKTIERLSAAIDKTQSGWLTLVGLVLTFSGLLLALVNLSFYFTASDQIKLANEKSERLLSQYNSVRDAITSQNLLFESCKNVQQRLGKDFLIKNFSDSRVIYQLLSMITLSLALPHATTPANKHYCIDQLLKIDIDSVKHLLDVIANDSNLCDMYKNDVHYINSKLREYETAS